MPKRKTKPLSLPDPTDPVIRWFLDCDQDCHYHIVPVSKRDEWEQWLAIDPEDPNAWTPPPWAIPVDGPHQVTFVSPVIL